MKKINLYLIIISIFLTSCQSIKDGLSGKKAENSDEFLVKKKSPLVMPPKFMELPKPGEQMPDNEAKDMEKSTDIQTILDLQKVSKNKPKKSGSAEDYVLKKIQNK